MDLGSNRNNLNEKSPCIYQVTHTQPLSFGILDPHYETLCSHDLPIIIQPVVLLLRDKCRRDL